MSIPAKRRSASSRGRCDRMTPCCNGLIPLLDEKLLLSRFWQSASGYWRGPAAWRAWLLVAVLIVTVLLQLLTQYALNYWNCDFFNAIGRRDAAELWTQALRFVPLAAASLALTVFSVWARMTMQRTWRAWLSNHLYDYWLNDDRYVRLRFVAGDYDSPEFRIAEDARIATDLPVDLVLGLFQSLLNAVTFIGILWSVGDGLAIDLGGFVLNIPGYLVIAVIVYSALLSAGIFLIARHLTRVMEENKRAEAELRSIGHASARKRRRDSRAGRQEGPAPCHRRAIEGGDHHLADLYVAADADDGGDLFEPFGDPGDRPAAVHPEISCRHDEPRGSGAGSGRIRRCAGAFSWFTDNYARLAEWASSANRVASLLLALDEVDQPDRTKDAAHPVISAAP